MPKCSICDRKQLIMERCIRCNTPICPEHRLEVANDLTTKRVGNQIAYEPTFAYFCPNCFTQWGLEVGEKRRQAWITSFGIDYCPSCGNEAKLTFNVGLPKHHMPVPDVVRGSKVGQVPFIQREVKCTRCERVYAAEQMLLNMPNRDFKGTGDLFKPKYAIVTNMAMYNEYVNGIKAERAGRYSDAAHHFERAGFVDKARSLRDASRIVRHEHKHITLDVNRMLEALDRTGYTIPYKCPGCGATIKLNKERGAERFLICEYCSTNLRAVDVEALIKQVL
ncbi:MAG: hypothetical protein ISF22_07005 [Methanomassiliicoccus sp.]|nr:hypothetical protein [Methanomassiliicoccus sp.]